MTAQADLACAISHQPVGAMTRYTATIDSPSPVSGSYSFIVSAQGSGGTSNTAQGGRFETPGGPDTLSVATVGTGRGARVSAALIVETDDGRRCESQR